VIAVRRRIVVAVAFATAAVCGTLASPAAALPFPEGAYRNVELVGHLPEPAKGAVSINFIEYEGGREVMFVSSSLGLHSYDITKDPADPVLLSSISSASMRQPGDTTDHFFQNEDMNVDPKRKLVFMARDVTSHGTGNPGVYIIDAKDPAKMSVIVFHPLPEGHTTTCINECTHLWTSGLLLRREIFVTDITDPAMPITSPLPVDVGPFDTPAGTSHDVAVDAAGIAWVAGQGYLRGYWTSGTHPDPAAGGVPREASPLNPVLYGGGKVPAGEGGPADQGRFVHGSERPIGATASRGAPNYGGFGEGNLIYSAEEAYGTCPVGPFVISSLQGALDTDATGELENVGIWSPAEQEGMSDGGECSAHWFSMRDGLVAHGWYGQGTRFIDVRDPRNPIQVGFFRPDDAVTSAAYWHGDYVYVADYARGVDIVRFGPKKPSSSAGGPAAPGGKPPAKGEPAGGCSPGVALASKGLRLTRRSVKLAGTSACTSRVEVAVARVQAGKCRFVSARGRLGRAGKCTRPAWQRARGGARWTFAKRARLERGSYSVFVRAAGAEQRTYRLAVDRRGRARPTEAVVAPPK
jgi:hypothetical protein